MGLALQFVAEQKRNSVHIANFLRKGKKAKSLNNFLQILSITATRDKIPSLLAPDPPDIGQKDGPPCLFHPQPHQPTKQHQMTSSNSDKNDVLMAKIPENEEENSIQRSIELAPATVIVNKRITTPVILEIRPTYGSSIMNVAKGRRNIFSAMKLNDPTLKSLLPKT